jgi:hypothetical protein
LSKGVCSQAMVLPNLAHLREIEMEAEAAAAKP